MNPAGPKTYVERTHKEIHCRQLTSELDDQVLPPSVDSSPLKNEIMNTMDPVNASTRKSEQTNIPCSVNELQTDSVLQSHNINEKTACVKNQFILQVR